MNDPRFEVYPRLHTVQKTHVTTCNTCDAGIAYEKPHDEPTGDFGWRFRAANGQISGVSGEGFTRREDAHRAVDDFLKAAVPALGSDIMRVVILDIDPEPVAA